jgi:hypothetical protein
MKRYGLVFLCAAAMAVAACGEDANNNGSSNNNGQNNNNNNSGPVYQKPDGSSCGKAGRSGVTACQSSAAGECQAGQFCNVEELTCSVGCTSDNNCADNQYCDIQGGLGQCKNCVVYTPPAPDPDPNPNPNPNPSTSACDTGGGKLITCSLADAAMAAQFIATCKAAQAEPELKPAIDAVLNCIELSKTDCAQMAKCVEDGDPDPDPDPDPNPNPMDSDCDKAATKATACDLLTAAEAADLVTSCKAKEAAGLVDEDAFCLASSLTCEDADLCFF